MKNTHNRLVDLLTTEELAAFIDTYNEKAIVGGATPGESLAECLTDAVPNLVLKSAFIWEFTKQGHDYWAAISDRIQCDTYTNDVCEDSNADEAAANASIISDSERVYKYDVPNVGKFEIVADNAKEADKLAQAEAYKRCADTSRSWWKFSLTDMREARRYADLTAE